MNRIVTLLFVAVGLVNLMPAIGALSDAQLTRLYQLPVPSAELSLLLRHRAVLLGLVGGLLLCAAAKPRLRTPACWVGLISMMSFVLLVLEGAVESERLHRIAWIDLLATGALLAATAARVAAARRR